MVIIVVILLFMLSFDHFFFFKQKTAYEMRISDWSSDVCSSDLAELLAQRPLVEGELHVEGAREAGLQRLQRGIGEALGLQALVSHAGRIPQRAVADRGADDRLDAAPGVDEGA